MSKSVLIVEDSAVWASRLRRRFEQMGYTVRIASDLESAWKQLDEHAFSIVTVDMCLGESEAEGRLLLEDIRDYYKQIPCVIISGSSLEEETTFDIAREYPMIPNAGYIEKSKFNYKRLKELVDRICPAEDSARVSDSVVDTASREGLQQQKRLTRLRQILDIRFDEGELRTLCFDLDLDYDDLPGRGKADKARELVSYLERHDRIAELMGCGKQLRSDILWEEL